MYIKYSKISKNGEIKEVQDTIFDIKVLPNRAHDALCHLGMAREVAACLDLTFKKEEIDKYENLDNFKSISKFEFDYVFNCAGNTGDFRNQILETVESNISLAIFLLNLFIK